MRLTALTFEEGTLGSEAVLALAPSLKQLSELRRLALDEHWEEWENSDSSDVLAVLSGVLSGLTSLEHLVIRGVGLSSEHFIRIFPGLTALQHLDISGNSIEDGVAVISPVLATLTALTHLDLSNNYMWENRGEDLTGDYGVTSIASCLTTLTGLLHLDLSYNNQTYGSIMTSRPLGDAAVATLGRNLPAALRWLSLDCNGISADGIVAITPGLRRLTVLEHLDLSDYVLETDSVDARVASLQALAGCVQCMPGLRHMVLACNDFNGPGCAEALAGCLKHAPTLQKLELGYNKLDVDGARHLAGCLQHMPALRVLGLCGNNFGDDGAAELVDSLLALTSLAKIEIRVSRISEAVKKILKATFNRPGRTPLMWL